jgi:hypothetical protein
MSVLNTVGPALRKARIEANLTQTDVAESLGISLWTYNRLENGRRTFEQKWVRLLPPEIRPPIVQLLTSRAMTQLRFLRSLRPPVGSDIQRIA